MPVTIEHSGQTWTSLGVGPAGYQMWPVEELFARHPATKSVQDRIRRLNPNGKEEGGEIRGWFPKPRSWRWAKAKLQAGIEPRQNFRGPNGQVICPWMSGPLLDRALLAGKH